ncbi:MAG TPA: acyltransferase, partial [Micromonospora sp.]
MTPLGIQPEASTRRSFRGDIEGMRALAVILVLVGHAAPGLLPGGFVGVDVFFVISGFLITGLLVEELDRTGRISLAGFYARRARRLLPAAALVGLVSLLLAVLFLPKVRWADTGWDAVASALYAMNWRLAEQAVDYLAADNSASILQHYWSLAVEEQFYLLWPLLLVVFAGGWRRPGHPRRRLRPMLLVAALVVVAVPSFVWSVVLTQTDPARAYFVSTTRLWELALGGGLALAGARLRRMPAPVAAGVAWASVAAILAAAALLAPDHAFPGYLALLPTLGAAAVIAGGLVPGGAGPERVLGLRPLRATGAVSYSLYLWHWPVLVAAEARFGDL